jgi:hypothetical protein
VSEEYVERAVDHGIKPIRGFNRYNQKTALEDLPSRERKDVLRHRRNECHEGLRWHGLQAKLNNSVGLPFTKVFHELCEQIKTFRGNHEAYREMIWWYVEPSAYEVAPGVFMSKGRRIHRLYVHPRTGLLCKSKKAWDKLALSGKYEKSYYWKQEVRYIENVCYRKINGHWYEVILANVPRVEVDYTNYREDKLEELNLYDVVIKATLNRWNSGDNLEKVHGSRDYQNRLVPPEKSKQIWSERCGFWYGGSGRTVYAKAIRQLKEKEIRRLGLDSSLKMPDIVR